MKTFFFVFSSPLKFMKRNEKLRILKRDIIANFLHQKLQIQFSLDRQSSKVWLFSEKGSLYTCFSPLFARRLLYFSPLLSCPLKLDIFRATLLHALIFIEADVFFFCSPGTNYTMLCRMCGVSNTENTISGAVFVSSMRVVFSVICFFFV